MNRPPLVNWPFLAFWLAALTYCAWTWNLILRAVL
jgi:hypothetical protein